MERESTRSGLEGCKTFIPEPNTPYAPYAPYEAMDVLPLKKENVIRSINIEQLDYGYTVRVGCQTFAISKKHDLINLLNQYIEDPNTTESLYNKGKLF